MENNPFMFQTTNQISGIKSQPFSGDSSQTLYVIVTSTSANPMRLISQATWCSLPDFPGKNRKSSGGWWKCTTCDLCSFKTVQFQDNNLFGHLVKHETTQSTIRNHSKTTASASSLKAKRFTPHKALLSNSIQELTTAEGLKTFTEKGLSIFSFLATRVGSGTTWLTPNKSSRGFKTACASCSSSVAWRCQGGVDLHNFVVKR